MRRWFVILGVGGLAAAAAGVWFASLGTRVEALRGEWSPSEGRPPLGLGAEGLPDLDGLPPHVVMTVLLSEDALFAVHEGIDWAELQHAIRRTVFAGSPLRGASTLTQQLARTAFLDNERSVRRKLMEAFYAREIEERFSKPEILALYLQSVHWGPGIHGLPAASRVYFAKEPAELSLEEITVLVSLLPNPDERALFLREGGWERNFWVAVMRRTLKAHQVLFALDARPEALPSRGGDVLELPLQRLLGRPLDPEEKTEVAQRANRSLERVQEIASVPEAPPASP